MSAYLKHQSLHSRTHIPIFMLRGMPGLPASTVLAPLRKDRHSQNGTDKSHDFQLLPVAFWLCFLLPQNSRKAEAGRGGILRSINRNATCPAMWRLTFSGGGHLVRLSANGCQPHRPNTALIFCAAGYHPSLLRTFRDYF